MQSVNIEQARKTLGELVDQARIGGQHTLITRYNKPAAVLVSAEWYGEVTGDAPRPDGNAS